MFVDRRQEDRRLSVARTGVLDAVFERVGEWRVSRLAAAMRTRRFLPGRELTFRLGQGKYMALTGYQGCRVRCERGAIWMTVEGDNRDQVLTPGQTVTLPRGGKLVISGRGEHAEVRVAWD